MRFIASLLCYVLTITASATAASTDPLAPLGIKAPPQAAVKPVTETFFGTKVTDNYRYMEKLDAATVGWMKAQAAYTRSVFDAIAPRTELGKRMAAFTGSFGALAAYDSYGGRDFYLERTPGADNFDLFVRDAAGTRKLVDIAALRAKNGGEPYTIDYFLAAPDGSKVAVAVEEGDSGNVTLTVYDAKTGAQIAGPIDRAHFAAGAWSDDATILYFNRLQELKPGAPQTAKRKNSALCAWDLKSAPIALSGAATGHGPKIGEDESPLLSLSPGAPLAILHTSNGAQNGQRLWMAPAQETMKPDANWQPFVDRDAAVTAFEMRGDEIFLLSHKDAPTFKVLRVKAGAPWSSATTLVAAEPDRVIEAIHAAADALYVLARKGAYSQLLRLPSGTNAIEEVTLPFKGHGFTTLTDPRQNGITLDLSSWVEQPVLTHYDPAKKSFTPLAIGTRGDIDAAAFKVSDLEAKARDGVMVPLTLIQPKHASGAQITLIEAYGSYGASITADFGPRHAATMREGITSAVCHVRGGGELGENWHLGGKDANKRNTWQDLIACSEDLIRRGVTDSSKLFIAGDSAGGIAAGRAMTEQPDLFAGVFDDEPAANMLRLEFHAPVSIPEFGTVTTEPGFKNLYDMDSIQHVRKGTHYPPIMITTGLNDRNVPPWGPSKFAAALQAAGTPSPVLLRVDDKASHAQMTRAEGDEQTADAISFMFWRASKAGWRPEIKH